MKKLSIFAIALLVLSFAACSEGIEGDCSPGTEQACDQMTGKLYTGSGKIYMTDQSMFTEVTEETMLEVGIMNNGKITLALPENVDSRFLEYPVMYAEPPDVEAWRYTQPLRLVSNSGKHIGDLIYQMVDEIEYRRIFYWYFSKDAKINYPIYNFETDTCIYNIDAEKGWNKVYFYTNFVSKACYTTDSSEASNGMWLFGPPSH